MATPTDATAREAVRQQLLQPVLASISATGVNDSQVPGLRLFRSDAPTSATPTIYQPTLCLLLQGSKQLLIGEEQLTYSELQYLLVPVLLPVSGKIVKASSQAQARIQTLRAVTDQIVKAAPQDAALSFRVADDYLRCVALVLLDWAWLRIETGVNTDTPDADTRWLTPAKALRSWVLPEFQMRSFIIVQQCTAAR